jgi:hypothetical protein
MHFVHSFCDGNSITALRKNSIDIQIRDNLTNVYLKQCTEIREKKALSCHMHALVMEDTIWCMGKMCWILYTTTHQPALITFLLQQYDFLIVQYDTVWMKLVVFLWCTTSTRLAARWQISPFIVFLTGAAQDCGHPSICLSCVVDWRGGNYKKWCTQSTQL